MRVEPHYRVRFTYSGGWTVDLAEPESAESQHFFLAEGRCEGRISGRFLGANHPHRRSDGTYLPDIQGVIETDDGAEVLFDYKGYGRAYPVGRRQILASATHLSEDEHYRWLNDSLSVGVGEVCSQEDGPTELVIEWAELVWEPISD
jgi:hypothetical protein